MLENSENKADVLTFEIDRFEQEKRNARPLSKNHARKFLDPNAGTNNDYFWSNTHTRIQYIKTSFKHERIIVRILEQTN